MELARLRSARAGIPGTRRSARAAAISKAAGKPMAFVEVPLAQDRKGLEGAGLPSAIIEAISEIQELWANGAFDVTTGDVERLAGRRPRRLGEVLAERSA